MYVLKAVCHDQEQEQSEDRMRTEDCSGKAWLLQGKGQSAEQSREGEVGLGASQCLNSPSATHHAARGPHGGAFYWP